MVDEGIMTKDEVDEIVKQQFEFYNSELQAVDKYEPEKSYFKKQWEGFTQASSDITTWDTGVDWELLSYIGRNSVYHPPDFVSLNSFIYRTLLRKLYCFRHFIHTLKKLSSMEESRNSQKELESTGQLRKRSLSDLSCTKGIM